MFGIKNTDKMEQVRYATYARVSSNKQDLESQTNEIAAFVKPSTGNLPAKYVYIVY